jgi:hypothetical protein
MAKSKSTNKLPARYLIEKRLQVQQRRVFQAQAICSIASRASEQLSSKEAKEFSEDAWSALAAVAELLGNIACRLDTDEVLAQITPAEKDAEDFKELRP